MDALSYIEGDTKKLSILSADLITEKESDLKKLKEEQAPPDPYHLTHILFFFFAIGSSVPYTFFFTAQDYWMYKFRDVSNEDYDLKNKTVLQQNFGTISSMAHTVPGILTTILSSYYGHKINVYYRLIGCLSTILAIFIIFTIFIEVNTDPWQIEFFILTIVVSTGITVSLNLMHITTLAIVSRFPNIYIKTQMYGSAFSSIGGALLQIFCLYLGHGNHTRTALIYFLCGLTVLAFTVYCAVMCKYVPRFAYYLGDTHADTKRRSLTLAEMKQLPKILWPNITIMITSSLTAGMAPTTLFVTENYGHGDLWSDKYFIPVACILWGDILGLVGRYLSFPLLTPKNAIWFVMADTLRYFTCHPLILFCNFLPRKHLPVLFPHDYQFIILMSVNGLAGNFFSCCTSMSMKNMLGDKAEQGFLFMATLGSISGVFHSALSTFWVNMI